MGTNKPIQSIRVRENEANGKVYRHGEEKTIQARTWQSTAEQEWQSITIKIGRSKILWIHHSQGRVNERKGVERKIQ